MAKTAGIIIIGDEILSGKVQDSNSFFMAQELRSKGIFLERISVIPDDLEEIAAEVKLFSERFHFVFTSGGIGPTHDDMTIEGIARAFGVPVITHGGLDKVLRRFYGENLTPEQLKMADVPEGAELIHSENTNFPLIRFRNIFIFPGIPALLRKKFHAIEKLFDEQPLLLRKVYINEFESAVAPSINEVVREYPGVKIGSYPYVDRKDYMVMVTFESFDDEVLSAAVKALTDRIPAGKLVKVE